MKGTASATAAELDDRRRVRAIRFAFDRLLKLALRDHHAGEPIGEGGAPDRRRGVPWVSADLVAQDALYEIQADLLDLLLSMARILGDAQVDRLVSAMPWAFTEVGS